MDTASPRVLRATIKTVYVFFKKNGTNGTRYSSVKRPAPVLRRFDEYPPMRASTLATFVEVSTLPETCSPLRTTGLLISMLIISGAALCDEMTGGGGAT